MNFTTRQIAELLGAGSHGPDCAVHHVAIDPSGVEASVGQLFAASAHPPPLGDTTLQLEGGIADQVPYLTERSWVGGTAVNGPSVETMLRRLAADERGRPATGDRVGVLGATAPWATAALTRAALGSIPTDGGLPPPGPPDQREIGGTERFRMPLALLNHAGDGPVVVELNRRHRGCAAADAALLDPTALVVTDLGDRHLATLGRTGALTSTIEVVNAVKPDVALVMAERVADELREAGGLDEARGSKPLTFGVRRSQVGGAAAGCLVRVDGWWGEIEVDVGPDGGSLALPVGAAIALGVAAGHGPDVVGARVGAAVLALVDSMTLCLAEGPTVWDRTDATSFGDVCEAIDALAARNATAKFLVLGPLDDGPTVTDGLHRKLGALATSHQIVVRSAEAWGSGFSLFEHPQNEVDDLAAAGPGAVILLAGGGAELHSVRSRFLDRVRVTT